MDQKDGSGLVYRRNRYYDPSTGRFTQEDPIGLAGGLNLYGFAGGDPINFSDPFGLSPCLIPPVAAACWTLINGAVGATAGGLASPGFAEGAAALGDHMLENARTVGLVGAVLVTKAVNNLVPGLMYSEGANDARPQRQRGETANFNHAVRELGVDRAKASAELHRIKKAEKMGGADNVWINSTTGSIRSQKTGEIIGNLLDAR